MKFDYTLLKELIAEKFGKHYVFAAEMDMSAKTLSLKLNNNADWSQREISRALQLLEIDGSMVNEMFFKYI